MKKETIKTVNIIVTIGTYLSYCLAFAYSSWGLASTFSDTAVYAIFFNRITAPLLSGLMPFAIFFFVARSINVSFARVPAFNVPQMSFVLKLFIISANIICFFVSFVYFAFRPLFVWGNILFNFIITAIFLTGYIFYMVPRIADKSKIALFITRTGGSFLFVYLLISIINIVVGLL